MKTALKLKDRLKIVPSITKIVDELGEVSEQRKELEVREKELKQSLYNYGPGVYNGKEFGAIIKDIKRTGYKTELLRIHVMPDILKKCEVLTAYLTCITERKSDLT
jgi:hypothetical protein